MTFLWPQFLWLLLTLPLLVLLYVWLLRRRKALALRKGVCGDDRTHHRKKDSSFHCRIVWVRHKFEFDGEDKWG